MSSPESEGAGASKEADQGNLRKRVVSASFWVLVGRGGDYAIRLVSNITLTRLLFEEAFGLMALATVFMVGLSLFSDIGVGPAIIQSKRSGDPRFLDTAWSIQCIRGTVLFLVCLFGAYPFSIFYGEPILARLIPFVGLTAVIGGFNSTKFWEAELRLDSRSMTVVELVASVTGVSAMVTYALIEPSVWALAVGGVSAAAMKLILSHAYLKGHNNRFDWDSTAVRSIASFGRWIFGSTIITFLVGHTDRLIFGKMVPTDVLGVYHIGATLASLPRSLLGMVAERVVFPLASQLQNQDQDIGSVFVRSRQIFTTAAGWCLCGFVAGGEIIVGILFDDRYAAAGWIVQLLSLSAWVGCLQISARPVILARADVKYFFFGNIARLLAMLVFIPLGYYYYEFPGAVAGYGLSTVANYLVINWAMSRLGLGMLFSDVLLTSLLMLAAAVAYWVSSMVVASAGLILGAVTVFVIVSCFWALPGLKAWRAFKQQRR